MKAIVFSFPLGTTKSKLTHYVKAYRKMLTQDPMRIQDPVEKIHDPLKRQDPIKEDPGPYDNSGTQELIREDLGLYERGARNLWGLRIQESIERTKEPIEKTQDPGPYWDDSGSRTLWRPETQNPIEKN